MLRFFCIYKQNLKINKEMLLGVPFPKNRNVPLTAFMGKVCSIPDVDIV